MNQSGVSFFARCLADHFIDEPKEIAQGFNMQQRGNFVTCHVINCARKRGLAVLFKKRRAQFLHDGFHEIVVNLIRREREDKPTHRPHVDRNIARLWIGHSGRQTWGSYCPAVACRAIEACRELWQISRVYAVQQTARAG